MADFRIALAQVNPIVGNLQYNKDLCVTAVAEAAAQGADLVAFPEMALTGYPIEDLALRPSFGRAAMRTGHELAEELQQAGLGTIVVVVGTLVVSDRDQTPLGVPRNEPRNAAYVIAEGQVQHSYFKGYLPNYGVFDEARYFVPGAQTCTFAVGDAVVTLAICEDLWRSPNVPVQAAAEANADLLLVINGSPFEIHKDDSRRALCQQRSQEAGCALAYVNMWGGQDELVFDGDSMVVDRSGSVLARGTRFAADLVIQDLPIGAPAGPAEEAELSQQPTTADQQDMYRQIYDALVVGTRDYCNKNGFPGVLLGLSGGIDSALVAAVAVDAVGAENVTAIAMPSKYSSTHSVTDAQALAEATGIDFRIISIAEYVAAFTNLDLSGLAEENLQARLRGVTLMAISNSEGQLVLATGNKSEIAVGYSTIYGDAVGGYAPIKDVTKTQVWELARWRNEQARLTGMPTPIPQNSIDKEPSAELRPGQQDSDSLPDYAVLDQILDLYVEGDRSLAAMVELGYDSELVQRILALTDRAEYKRRQYPPGPKITSRAFGRDRRLPISNGWRNSS